MSWKGALRSIVAAQRREEREELKRKRELERQRKRLETLQEFEQAAYEVDVFNNYVQIISSIHKDCGEFWDWEAAKKINPPQKPERGHKHEELARFNLESYNPSFVDKIFKRDTKKIKKLQEELKIGKKRDEEEHKEAYEKFLEERKNWELMTDLAQNILDGDEKAYIKAINELDPFSEINYLGSQVSFHPIGNNLMEVVLHVNSEEVVPKVEKYQLKSGKLSEKDMSKTKFYKLYQDYVCSAVLRVARELFALLPIDLTFVTAEVSLLNTTTGNMEDQPILSVFIPRKSLEKLNFQRIDPSDSMNNFVHRMKFLKTKGFRPVEKLSHSDIEHLQNQSAVTSP